MIVNSAIILLVMIMNVGNICAYSHDEKACNRLR